MKKKKLRLRMILIQSVIMRMIQCPFKASCSLTRTKGKGIPHLLPLRVRLIFPYLPTYMKKAIFSSVCQEELGSVQDFQMDMNLVEGS